MEGQRRGEARDSLAEGSSERLTGRIGSHLFGVVSHQQQLQARSLHIHGRTNTSFSRDSQSSTVGVAPGKSLRMCRTLRAELSKKDARDILLRCNGIVLQKQKGKGNDRILFLHDTLRRIALRQVRCAHVRVVERCGVLREVTTAQALEVVPAARGQVHTVRRAQTRVRTSSSSPPCPPRS